jgi:mono/diheme cytochrome c family protein
MKLIPKRILRATVVQALTAMPATWLIMILIMIISAMPFLQSVGADEPRVMRGRALAARHCAACHAIGNDDARPHDIVLAFREFPERYPIAMLEDARATGTIAGHDEMPGFDFSKGDMEALLAYIDTFARGNQRYLQ